MTRKERKRRPRAKLSVVKVRPEGEGYRVWLSTMYDQRFTLHVSESVLHDHQLFSEAVWRACGRRVFGESDPATWVALVRYKTQPRVG